jgi:hypothetical protein
LQDCRPVSVVGSDDHSIEHGIGVAERVQTCQQLTVTTHRHIRLRLHTTNQTKQKNRAQRLGETKKPEAEAEEGRGQRTNPASFSKSSAATLAETAEALALARGDSSPDLRSPLTPSAVVEAEAEAEAEAVGCSMPGCDG